DEKQKREKQASIVNSCIEAINLGQHDAVIVRRVVEFLFGQGRANEVVALMNKIPVESQLAGDLGHKVAQVALDHREFQAAEDIARKIVAADPSSFKERLWLVQVLQARGHQDTAEKELEAAVELSKSDPDRWIVMVRWYLGSAKQIDKAEQAIQRAEQ